jgi:Family of unknown function (DUF5678)
MALFPQALAQAFIKGSPELGMQSMANTVLVNGAARYGGQYVTVKSFASKIVVTHGKNAKDVFARAKKRGIEEPVLIYVPEKKMARLYWCRSETFPSPTASVSADQDQQPHTKQSIKVLGLVDTGASACAFPGDIAGFLGHNLLKGAKSRSSSAGGAAESYAHSTTIEIYDFKDKRLLTLEKIQVGYMPRLQVPLLGVKNFLEKFHLHVAYPKKEFSILRPK